MFVLTVILNNAVSINPKILLAKLFADGDCIFNSLWQFSKANGKQSSDIVAGCFHDVRWCLWPAAPDVTERHEFTVTNSDKASALDIDDTKAGG